MRRVYLGAIVAIVLLAAGFAFLIAGTGQAQADTIYVNAAAGGANNGTSWTDAYTDVQSALAVAVATDEIWVAEGIYYPDEGTGQTNNSRFSVFQLKENVDLYGGFPDSGSPTWAQRDWTVNITVLSGDLQQDDITDPYGVGTTTANIVGSNAYNVVSSLGATGITEVTVLDGFTVTGGNANGGACPGDAFNAAACGGGMSNDGNMGPARPTIQHVIFSANHGNMYAGGMLNWGSTASPVLDDVTFVANTSQTGGGMYSQWGNQSLTDVVFDNNYASNYGGGIYISGGAVNIISGTFTDNSGNYGGGIYAYESVVSGTDVAFISNESRSGSSYGGGGICNRSGTLSLMNAVFDQNTANQDGGGIHNFNGTLSITSGTFTGNTTPRRGGGITSEADQAGGIARATVTDCLFDSNTSNDSGGGIYFSEYMAVSSSGTVIGCTFTNNTSTYGAGIQSSETMLAISDCIFDGNTATSSSGGGLACMAWGSATEVRVSGSTFNGNSAPYGGGVSNSYRITLTDCIFTANSASNGGGFRDNQSDSAIVTNCTFIGNTATNGAAVDNYGSVAPVYTDCIFSGNTATSRGGAMQNEGWGDGCTPQITNCMFSDNTSNYGGAIYNYWGSEPTITNCTFGNNTANFFGGGIYHNSSAGNAMITNTILWGNTPDQILDWGSLVTANYSDIQGGGFAGIGNIDQDPQFVGGGDLHIIESSPCANAGSNAAIPPGIVTDIDGDPRIILGIVDMGADENTGPIFVDKDAVGANNGSSWTDAFLNLQDGLAAATANRSIWVAEGTYTPVRPGSPGQRSDSFAMKNGVGIYGGFAGTETARNQRDPEINPTILSGDILVSGSPDYCYHVFYHSGSPVLDGSAILDGFIISDGHADGAGNDSYGGGMFNNGGSPTINNCTFTDNHAALDGGGMFNQNGAAPAISESYFGDNIARRGGGMFNGPTTAPVINSGTFTGNHAVGGVGCSGGGMFNQDNDAVINGAAFFSNNATWHGGGAFNELGTTPSYTGCTFSGNNATYGGGMSVQDVSPPIFNCDFLYNTADYGAGLYTDSCGSVITDCNFIDNDANIDGGGIYNTDFSGSISGCTFGGPLSGDGNTAIQHGGGMYNDSSSPPITECLFWNNSGSQGGGMYNTEYSHVVITSGTFMYNVAWESGGGIHSGQNFGGFTGSDIILTDCTFDTNTAYWGGGGFYNAYGDPVITNCDFNNNSALESGGGMHNYGGDPVITLTSFWLNSGSYGGGIYNRDNQAGIFINSGTFTSNHAYVGGGGIYNDSSGDLFAPGTVSDCYFGSNTADGNGGGMYNYLDYNDILNCTFEQNTAINGGGVYNYGNWDYFEGCTFMFNHATNRGGGAFNDGADTPEFVGCDFRENIALQGGGMANYDWIDTPVTNCLFRYNEATLDGGAMYNVQNAAPVVTDCTFQANTASGSGSGIYNAVNSHPVMTNCIFWDEEMNEVINDPTSLATVTYSLVWGDYPGNGNFSLNPMFIGPMNPRLQALSPCINSGSDTAVPVGITTDFDGNPRFIGTVDMGAFEDNSLEFGDAPDPTYPTLLASNGARHGGGALLLGALKDFELNGQPTATSDGDDINGLDDEDGVTFISPLYVYPSAPGTVTVDVVASGSCNLSAWMDFNIDGDWADAGEDLFPGGQALSAGINILSFQIPAGATPGTTYARFRATTDSVITYDGLASDGEVEDYRVVVLDAAGTIIVEKVTVPAGGIDTFDFIGDASGIIGDGQQIVVPSLMPGTYTSRELFTVGWQLTNITCDDSNSNGDVASGSITFRVEVGETVTCYCTNTQLYPSAEAADEKGAGQEEFAPEESVYGAGSQFTPGSSVDIYITENLTWFDGMKIPGIPMVTAIVNGSGTFHIEVWPPPLTIGEYDMVFDADQSGYYDTSTDIVDDPNHPGFVVASPAGGGPTVGGQIMLVNKSALLMQFIRLPMGLMLGFAF